ncbi:metal-dependent transcriptional regulator [Corynebacterium propinquum]|uniref:metal-dependent transcriptional regulator n=1 Tax=Corynebacterium propinquum TaxID=43769 RepID=UPI0006659CD8|nr:metal-dependent transcriptional regulator [Corynebacterium propinquum]
MHIGELPQRTQEYLKLLWGISERAGESGGQASVSLSELSRRAQQKNSTTSEAIKRLQSRGLVEHEPYSGVRLTELGARLAVTMIRRHRLIETFLVETLGYTWDEIHADADLLEHAATDRFIDRIDELLNFPTRDPHGDPIPSADGRVEDLGVMSLAECTPGLPVIIEQVNDEDPELLRYLAAHGIAPGSKVCVTSPSVAGLVHVQVLTPIVEEPIGDPVALAIKAAADVKIIVADDSLADDHGAGDNPVTTR